MKIILKVARTELRTLFYSPIAWFLMIVFLIQCGIIYFGQLNGIARQQELGGYGLEYMNKLTEVVFLSSRGLFGSVMNNLFLYIPLLTMSLISRETSSGTIKLLYSSPIKVHEIILGKYLSMLAYSLILVAIVGIFCVSGIMHLQYAETAMLMTALLGFFLLLCAYSAIGLFMSTLTTYQVVAAICTFIMIGILNYIGTLWQRIDIVRELTYFLSINGRAAKLLAGLITTKDIIYFLVIVGMFLGFSICRLKAQMESRSLAVRSLRYIGIVAVVLLIGYLSAIPGFIGYYDVTSSKSRTITPQVQKILGDLGDEPLEITTYVNLVDNRAYLGGPESHNSLKARWEPYQRFKHNIELKTVSYWDTAMANPYLFQSYPGKSLEDIARQYAKMNDVKLEQYFRPEQIRQQIDLRPEENRFVMHLQWKGHSTFLRVFDDGMVWPGETEVAAALKRLQQTRLPRVGFVTGHLERQINKIGDRDYKSISNLSSFRYSLVNQGFDVATVHPDTEEIPADIAVLVLADPKVALGAETTARLEQYINNGGNMLIMGEPGKQAILNPLLAKLGVRMDSGMVIQENKELAPNIVTAGITPFVGSFTRAAKRAVEDSIKVSLAGVAGLVLTGDKGFAVQPLLVTDPELTWNRIKPLDLELVQSAKAGKEAIANADNEAAAPHPASRKSIGVLNFDPAEGDVKGPVTAAIAAIRKHNGKEQRIVVVGDADLMSNAELRRANVRTANFAFNVSLFSWLSYGEFPVEAFRPDAKDKRINLTSEEVGFYKILYVWVAPAMLLAMAAVLLIRRKRK